MSRARLVEYTDIKTKIPNEQLEDIDALIKDSSRSAVIRTLIDMGLEVATKKGCDFSRESFVFHRKLYVGS